MRWYFDDHKPNKRPMPERFFSSFFGLLLDGFSSPKSSLVSAA